MGTSAEPPSDEQLLAATFTDEDAFATFYARYERPVAAFFMRAVGSGELAADLTAEVFAQALAGVGRFDPEIGRAGGWLFGIARNILARSFERGRVEDRARRRLGLAPLALDDEIIVRLGAGEAGDRVLIDGRAYGFCGHWLDFTLVDVRPHGLVYGFAALPNVKAIAVTPNFGFRAGELWNAISPQVVRQTATGTFFLAALHASACTTRSLWIAVGAAASKPTAGLTGGDEVRRFGRCRGPGNTVAMVVPPPPPSLPGPPAGLSATARAEFLQGRLAAQNAGCEACHTIGAAENDGPGPPLTDIGSKLGPAALRSALVDPTAPMPSFRAMKPPELRALVAFLSELRGQR